MSIMSIITIPAEEKLHVNESKKMKKNITASPSDVFDQFESWGLKQKLRCIRASVFEDAVPPVYP